MAEQEQAAGLWKIKHALTVASITAMTGLIVVMTAVLAVLGFPHLQHTEALPFSQLLDVLKLVFGTVAGVGALFALVMAYRRQRLAEFAETRDRGRAALELQRARDDLTRVFNERFGAASAQLGHDEPAIRLAGAYALAGLADDWEQGRQTCINVLCATLRLSYAPDPGEEPAEGQDPAAHTAARTAYLAAREVRHTVLRIITNHLNGHTDVSWRGHDLDFRGAVFDGGDFQQAVFTNDATVSFQEARFMAGTVNFGNARFKGGTVNFGSAHFQGGTVSFRSAHFEAGTVNFGNAWFKGGTVDFGFAHFQGGMVDFGNTRFKGGMVDFGNTRFKGGTVNFQSAGFEAGMVDFGLARFEDGTVNFQHAAYGACTLDFESATGRWPVGLPAHLARHLS